MSTFAQLEDERDGLASTIGLMEVQANRRFQQIRKLNAEIKRLKAVIAVATTLDEDSDNSKLHQVITESRELMNDKVSDEREEKGNEETNRSA